ncbi:MAG: alpha-glucosidase [Candidatus Eremiobacteraeota bacterium]|nr:alpha-glucosidase [Candidatus Eremiobacteraeota bacterium]
MHVTFDADQLKTRLKPITDGILRVTVMPATSQPRFPSWNPALAEEHFGHQSLEVDGERARCGPLEARHDRGRLAFSYQGEAFACDLETPSFSPRTLEQCRGLFARPDDSLPENARLAGRLAKQMLEHEGYFGFGQRNQPVERSRYTSTNWTKDPEWGHTRKTDPTYQAHPTFLTVSRGFCWGLFLQSTFYSRFDHGETTEQTMVIEALGGQLDYFLFYGKTPAEVVERLTRLTGRPMLVPQWALGYHQSRWGYQAADELLELAREFRDRELPIDVLHLDIDYMDGYRSFSFHPQRFAGPAELTAELAEQGIRAVTIIDPGIKHDLSSGYATARTGAHQDMFLTDATGAPYIGYCWPDAAMFPDFARPEVRQWWGEQHQGHVEAGIAGIWNDMNEPAIFDRPFSAGLAGHLPMPLGLECGPADERTNQAELHNLYGSQMAQATFEGLRRLRPGLRPWVLTRSAFTGAQQHAISWMGDNSSWWDHLELSIPLLASMGLGGFAHVGVDVGGFFGDCEAELYARWIEMAPFYPFMRTHSAHGTRRQEPWSFGRETEAIARAAIQLRYRLLPYLYSLNHQAHASGEPLMRPLMFDFPWDRRSWFQDDQFMCGPHLMVAPVVKRGQRHRAVYFPPGQWFDFYTGKAYEGGSAVAVEAPLGRAPLFARAGAVVPLGQLRQHTGQPLTELTYHLFPGQGEFTLWEDDGQSWQAPTAATRLVAGPHEFVLEARRGDYQPGPRRVRVERLGQLLAEFDDDGSQRSIPLS